MVAENFQTNLQKQGVVVLVSHMTDHRYLSYQFSLYDAIQNYCTDIVKGLHHKRYEIHYNLKV